MEYGERLEQCLMREVRQEAGLEVEAGRLLWVLVEEGFSDSGTYRGPVANIGL